MSYKSIRTSILGLVVDPYAAAYPTVPAAWDNSPFDWSNPPETFVWVEVDFQDADQVNIAVMPRTRYRGHVYVTVFVRNGAGTNNALDILDWFRGALAYRYAGAVQLREAKPDVRPDDSSGYRHFCIKVPFHSDGD